MPPPPYVFILVVEQASQLSLAPLPAVVLREIGRGDLRDPETMSSRFHDCLVYQIGRCLTVFQRRNACETRAGLADTGLA